MIKKDELVRLQDGEYFVLDVIKYGTKTDGGSKTCLGYAKYVFAYVFGIYSLNDAHIVKSYDLSYNGFKKKTIQWECIHNWKWN